MVLSTSTVKLCYQSWYAFHHSLDKLSIAPNVETFKEGVYQNAES